MSTSQTHTEQLERGLADIAKLQTESVTLFETKTDLSLYTQEIKKINETLDKAVKTSQNAESLTKNMVEFVYKYEPIYIQRQIKQTFENVLTDSNQLWRLNWFNDIKMPLLTTLLMYKSDVSLTENMKAFQKVITLNSLTAEELFIKNAVKNNRMQLRAVEII